MGTVVMVLFFVIVCVCGIILWLKKTQNVSPFLISVSPNNERWVMVAHDNHKTDVPAYFVLQESLLNNFAKNWFTISDNILQNQAMWSKDCSRDSSECRENTGSDVNTCAIYCACDDRVFTEFEKVVLPIYSNLESEQSAVWTVESVSINPVDSWKFITQYGGKWRLNIVVQTDTGVVNFVGFAKTGYDALQYPKTMGYYVSEFYTYRMN